MSFYIKWWLKCRCIGSIHVLVYYGPSSLRLVSFADMSMI